MTAKPSSPKSLGLKLFEIKTNWPIIDVDGYRYWAKSADSAWTKFVRQRFGALKPDRREWSIKEVE
jgi:hypothetical protein